MASHINLIAFGTFGNPNGFKQTFFVGSRDLAKAVKTFDLNTNAIKLFPNSRVYAIRKEQAAGHRCVAYCLYTYAKEQNSERSGTFIGSSILYTEKIAEETITINQINQFHVNLINKNTNNDVITVNHSDNLSVLKPRDFENVEHHLREIQNLNSLESTGKCLFVFSSITEDALSQLFKKSIDLLNKYDTIYFTDNREVAEFVNQKAIFKIIQNVADKLDFEQEIQALQEERRKIREQSISEFEREIKRLNEDKINKINEFKLRIEEDERIHQENDLRIKESKKDLATIDQFYNEFSNKTRELSNRLKSGDKLEVVRQIHIENKNRFIEGINTLKKPIYINKIPKISLKTNLKTEHHSTKIEQKPHRERAEFKESNTANRPRINIFKITTLILIIFLIFSWIYFLYINADKYLFKAEDDTQNINVDKNQSKPEDSVSQELSPVPNFELNESEYRLIAKRIKHQTKLEEIVKIIFDKNPSDIKSPYENQKEVYSKQLLELNKICFDQKDGKYFFTKDTLRHIPGYKKE